MKVACKVYLPEAAKCEKVPCLQPEADMAPLKRRLDIYVTLGTEIAVGRLPHLGFRKPFGGLLEFFPPKHRM
ncbi:hypothetical protein J6590_104462, partial [Homalodisca vitripennis]